MKRYAITPILEPSAIPDGEYLGYRSAAIDIQNTSVNSVIDVDSNTGVPLFGFSFDRIGRVDFGPIWQILNIYIFPDYPLDGEINGIESNVLAALKQSCEAYNLDGNGFHLSVDISDTTISYETLLYSIYSQFNSNLNLSAFRRFDASEGGQS